MLEVLLKSKCFLKQLQRCEKQEILATKTSNDSHRFWKKHLQKKPLPFRLYAVFEADNELDNSYMGNKTTSDYKQIPVCKGYYLTTQINDVLRSGYDSPPLEMII